MNSLFLKKVYIIGDFSKKLFPKLLSKGAQIDESAYARPYVRRSLCKS
jgi:hypothetical protein